MRMIKKLACSFLLFFPIIAFSQSTYLPLGSEEYHFIDRLEIKQQKNTDLNFSTLKPYNRRFIVQEAEFLDSARMGYVDSNHIDHYKEWTDLRLNPIDDYNLKSLLLNNSEWVTGSKEGFASKRPFLKTFYKNKANFYEVDQPNFFLAINPVFQLNFAKEQNNGNLVYINSRGISARGSISKKVGFYTMVTDNQERGPSYFQSLVNTTRAVPGVGFYKPFKTTGGFDYFDARGYFTFNAAKFIDFQMGYDKNFIGNGYRSLFLSDVGNSYLFVKINTRIWKFNYQNLYMELMPQFTKKSDTLLDRKYAAVHHLSINVTKWLNLGLFEAVVFGRRNRFDFQYLNPIIFYRHIEGTVGSPDNAIAGFDFKANVAKQFQFYGQFLLDEFRINELRKTPKSWVNKFGIQAGAKYIDAFMIKNLDLQAEVNRVRPFTYSHYDTTANFTHYNQPMAHPLGANFTEFIGIVRYQPAPRWMLNATVIAYEKGLDSLNSNFGGDIFKPYTTRSGSEFSVAGGVKARCLNAMASATFEFKENLFFDISAQYRSFSVQGIKSPSNTMLSAGIRVNMARRVYDY